MHQQGFGKISDEKTKENRNNKERKKLINHTEQVSKYIKVNVQKNQGESTYNVYAYNFFLPTYTLYFYREGASVDTPYYKVALPLTVLTMEKLLIVCSPF